MKQKFPFSYITFFAIISCGRTLQVLNINTYKCQSRVLQKNNKMKKINFFLKKFDIRKFSIFRRLPLLLSLTRRGVFFFSFLLAAQFLLFITGNRQNFLNENLKLILNFCSFTALGTAFFSTAAGIECIYYAVRQKKSYFITHLVIFFIWTVFTLSVAFSTDFIEIMSKGFA